MEIPDHRQCIVCKETKLLKSFICCRNVEYNKIYRSKVCRRCSARISAGIVPRPTPIDKMSPDTRDVLAKLLRDKASDLTIAKAIGKTTCTLNRWRKLGLFDPLINPPSNSHT